MKSKNKIVDDEKPKRKNKKFCSQNDCTKQPNFNIFGEKKGIYLCIIKYI